MDLKHLPIGTVCTLKGKNKKLMIIGYYSVEFVDKMTINDYVGCVYPEGMMLPNHTQSFNAEDIEKIDYVGYKNEELVTFIDGLSSLTSEYKSMLKKEEDISLTKKEESVEVIKEVEHKKIKEEYIFDEDGYVVSVQKEEVSNPFYTEKKEILKEEQKPSEWSIFKRIEFDENGVVVVAEEKEKRQEKKEEYIFDENGVVASVINNN